MEDKTLLKIALLLAIIGTCALFLISNGIDIETGNLELMEEGESIVITGRVSGIIQKENLMIFDILTKEKVILFDQANISEGDYIAVIGTVGEYNGEKEVIAEVIEKP